MGVNDMSDKSLVVRSGGALGVSGVRDLKSVESANALLNLREKISQNTALVSDEWLDRLIKWAQEHKKQNPNAKWRSYFPNDKNELRNAEMLYFRADDYEFDDLPNEFANLHNLSYLEFWDIKFKHFPRVICKLTWLKSLRIWNSHIDFLLPKEFANLQSLEHLNLHNFSNFSLLESSYGLYGLETICKLKNLKELQLSVYDLKTLPDEFINLQKLERLYLWCSNFSEFPSVITKIPTLTNLSIWDCELKNLPNELINLRMLKDLDIGSNNFGELPKIVTKLTTLECLDIWDCGLTNLPDELENLQKLEFLNIEDNNFSEFPQVILKLKNLKKIRMANCDFRTLPKDFARLQKLEKLDFGGEKFYNRCCLDEFPRVILELPNLKKIWIESTLIDDESAQILKEKGVVVNEP